MKQPEHITVELTPALVELLDQWRADQQDEIRQGEAVHLILYDYFISYGLIDIGDWED